LCQSFLMIVEEARSIEMRHLKDWVACWCNVVECYICIPSINTSWVELPRAWQETHSINFRFKDLETSSVWRKILNLHQPLKPQVFILPEEVEYKTMSWIRTLAGLGWCYLVSPWGKERSRWCVESRVFNGAYTSWNMELTWESLKFGFQIWGRLPFEFYSRPQNWTRYSS